MHDDATNPIVRLWQGLRKKTTEAFAHQEAALLRGKVVGRTVRDGAGNVIVDAGHPIDEAAIKRAKAAGRLSALMSAAVTAQTQDLREKVNEHYGRTQEGQEARILGSVDEYIEAHRYLGRIMPMDVTDIRGNVIVAAGKELESEDVRAARDAGQLGALLAVAEQAPPPTETAAPALPEPTSAYTPAAPPPRARLLTDPIEEEESAPEQSRR